MLGVPPLSMILSIITCNGPLGIHRKALNSIRTKLTFMGFHLGARYYIKLFSFLH